MPRRYLAFAILMAVLGRPCIAQPITDTSILSSRVGIGETLAVRLTSGEDVVGTFLSASVDALTVIVAGQSRTIAARDVERVVSRRSANRLVRGLLIGAPIGIWLGSSACYGSEEPGYPGEPQVSCGASLITGAAVGAGVGGLIGWLNRRPNVVYVAPAGPRPGEPMAGPEPPGPGLDTSIAVIRTRVQPFETIYVRPTNEKDSSIKGRLIGVSATTLQIEEDGDLLDIAAGDIQEVRRRGGTTVKRGMAWGLLIGATVGSALGLTADTTSEYSRGDIVVLEAIGGAIGGVLYGGLIGLFVHDRPVVYRASPAAPPGSTPTTRRRARPVLVSIGS